MDPTPQNCHTLHLHVIHGRVSLACKPLHPQNECVDSLAQHFGVEWVGLTKHMSVNIIYLCTLVGKQLETFCDTACTYLFADWYSLACSNRYDPKLTPVLHCSHHHSHSVRLNYIKKCCTSEAWPSIHGWRDARLGYIVDGLIT